MINVQHSITSTGSTALDILERSPGILVNRENGSISMSGKSGVSVMTNGRINRMPMSALIQILGGMPAGNIEKIELITTPPANFDAEGDAGFINIVLKKNENEGLNGNVTATYVQGRRILLAKMKQIGSFFAVSVPILNTLYPLQGLCKKVG